MATEVRELTPQPGSTGVQLSPRESGRSYGFVSEIEATKIVRLYATGMSALGVSEKTGRPPRTVTDTLRRRGVEIRRNTPVHEEAVSRMVSLYKTGLSCAQVAIELGVSRSNVGKHLPRAGVVLRSKSEAAALRDKR